MMDGIVVIDKPSGMTSHDVVTHVRRRLKIKRVGHAGTLDPLATGVLIALVGKATKLFDQFVAFDKAYQATLRLGTKTMTADIMGKVLSEKPFTHVSREDIEIVLKKYIGHIEQLPPMVSAVKHKGKRLYQLAREGKEVERTPRKIKIDSIQVMDFQSPEMKFYMECSKGTYVRQLAEDIGEDLGCGACISQIRRTKVGPFTIDEAIKLEDVHESHIRNWAGSQAV